LTDISHAIETSVRAAGSYGIVTGYGGHGIGSQMHMDPHLPNYGRPGRGPRLLSGMTLAIEPMITAGSSDTRQLPDRWTVTTTDGGRAAHWEHTVALLEDGPWVLTAVDGGRAELASRGVQLSALAD
jgi:methionyl aminopeptidase